MSHCLLLDGSIVELVLFDHNYRQCIDLPKPQKGTDKLEVASCYRGISVGFTSPIPTESHVRLAQATISGVSLAPGQIAEVCANHINFRRDFGKWRQSGGSNFEIDTRRSKQYQHRSTPGSHIAAADDSQPSLAGHACQSKQTIAERHEILVLLCPLGFCTESSQVITLLNAD